jgi:hypothetical protein
MRRAVACSSLWLLTCTGVPAVDRELPVVAHEQPAADRAPPPVVREPPAEIVAEPRQSYGPSAHRPDDSPGADLTEDGTSDVPEDMSGSPVHLAPTRPLPCTAGPSVTTLCDCLERYHRRSLGAEQPECWRSVDSRQASMRVFEAVVASGEPGGTVCYLAEKRAGGAAVIFAGPPVDSRDDCDFPGGYRRPLADGGELVHAAYEWTTRRSQQGECATTITTTSTDHLLCVREPSTPSTTVCDLMVPSKREEVTENVCDDPKKSRTSRRSAAFEVLAGTDGIVTTRLREGDRNWLKQTSDAAWITPRKLSLRRPKP